ncbi:premnaspirodiene oxygenase-like [Panicum miliaceum]|uniref:Premnaspirodiene oxygenase-like n=1 Tax=Panicum miliaceum TaxID=4540 RepID=A0A3L6PGG0_PANMI|nr:premnaspirodiene oxygenase-like [Panicum miliaceum]
MEQELQSSHHYIFLVVILLLPLLAVKLRRRNHGKNPPPGPWRLPVIGSLHHLVGALPHRAMRDLARRHGPLMLLRLGQLPVVVASSPDAAREVMRTHDAAFATRPRTATIRELTRDGLGVAFAPHGEHWRQLRKLCVTELLSARRVRSLRRGREAEAANLVAGAARRARAHHREMTRLMDGVIEEHRQRRAAGAGNEEEDLLDVLLRVQKEGSPQVPLDMGTIRAVIIDLFGAGSETTATTLQWAMAELVRHPAALRKAQAEVRRVLAGESRVAEDALPELRYLQLVMKETLRLHAAVPLLLPRECQEETRAVLGYDVPGGAMVLVNAWAIGRDAAIWGPDAEEFRPERFEGGGAGAEVDFRGTDFEFVPFGAGRRICPGIALGLAVMELGLASLLFHFDWELPGGAAPEELDMAEGLGITARRKSDLWLQATVRVPVPNI